MNLMNEDSVTSSAFSESGESDISSRRKWWTTMLHATVWATSSVRRLRTWRWRRAPVWKLQAFVTFFSRVAVEPRVVVDGHVRQLSDLSCGPTSRVLPSSGDVDTQQWWCWQLTGAEQSAKYVRRPPTCWRWAAGRSALCRTSRTLHQTTYV